MSLNHREISVFLAIARCGTINAAAQKVGMTQPALSRSLRRLEVTLGVRLFDRHPTGMVLTDFGRVLQRHAELVEFESERVVEELRMMHGATAGFVRVGLVPSVAGSLFRRALIAVNHAAPNVQVRVIEGASDQILEAVVTGEVDFAVIGQLQAEAETGVVTTPIGAEEVCVAARAAHPVFLTPDLRLADLVRYRWALPERRNAIWFGFNNLFRRNGLEPPVPALTTNSVHTLKSVVTEDDYLTMLTRVIFSVEEAHGLIRPIPLEETRWKRRTVVVRRHRRQLLPAARLLLDALERQAQS